MAYAIKKGSNYFNTVLYTGTDANNSVTGVGFSPNLLWLKSRTVAAGGNHVVYDTVRGGSSEIYTSLQNAEAANVGSLISLDSDGFTLGTVATTNRYNASSNTYVAWCWNTDAATVENTDGTVTTQVSASPTAGFSIVGYTGSGNASSTYGHGLSQAPELIIIKNRSIVRDWSVVGSGLLGDGTRRLVFNNTDAITDDGFGLSGTTSTTFSFEHTNSIANNTDNFIAYCWHSVSGYSKIGSYTGNGSTDGPFVYTGFKPSWVLVRRLEAIDVNNLGRWKIHDTTRDTYNPMGKELEVETSNTEGASSRYFDFLSNGFKVRDTNTMYNGSNYTYIYMAFAECPFKYATAR